MTPRPQRRPVRLSEYDYSMPGAYFVTACTRNRELLFGTPDAKLAVETGWQSLLDVFANIELDAFVVMPNHIHGIVWITGEGAYRLHPGTWKNDDPRRVIQFQTLSNVIGAFKTTAATRVNKIRGQIGATVWQRSFYDRIVRSERELTLIQKYILHNPIQWEEDRDNPINPNLGPSAKSINDYWNEIFDLHSSGQAAA